MFIYTFKASKIKFFAVVLLAVASLLALITLVPGYGDAGTVAAVTIDYNNIKTVLSAAMSAVWTAKASCTDLRKQISE